MPNMMETIKKAQQVGVKVKELQEELQNTEVEATAEDGKVTVTISGAQVPLSVEVTDEPLAMGAEKVSAAVSLAHAEAHKNSVEYAKQRMSSLYEDIGLPMPPQREGRSQLYFVASHTSGPRQPPASASCKFLALSHILPLISAPTGSATA